MGAAGTRHSLRPLIFEGGSSNKLAHKVRREGGRTSSSVMPRSKRGIQYSRGVSDELRRLWNAGSPGHRRAEATPSFGRLCRAMTTPSSLRGATATKQSILFFPCGTMDCFARARNDGVRVLAL